jgi:1,2-diacylglycerol 3-alpha-glucosyltransferase
VANDLKKRHFKRPIYMIPSGVKLIKAAAVKPGKIQALKKKYHLVNKRVLLTIGRISVEKNLAGLLRVFASVQAQEEAAHLVVIGQGPYLSTFKKMVAAKGLARSVTFLGAIPHEKLIADGYFCLGEIFVTASMSETQGMTAIEAQTFNLPVVAYNSRGLAEVVGAAGVLVPEGNEAAMSQALLKLLHCPKQLAQLKTTTQTHLQQFALPKTTAKVVRLYQKVIAAAKCGE